MRVFVLGTGRCGSMTLRKACSHITNFTAGHETGHHAGYDLCYPDRHIEVDNRLAWFLGRLHEKYPDAYYVHLRRDARAVAESFAARGARQPSRLLHGFMTALKQGRHAGLKEEARQLVDTIEANIRHFLRDKLHMVINIETAVHAFPVFWKRISAEGDLDAALAELGRRYNRRPAR